MWIRELAFFPGKAIGPAYGANIFCYNSEVGSCAAQVEWANSNNRYSLYYNGGCFFESAEKYKNVSVLARYAESKHKPAAVVQCSVGKGKAILCGVHPEYHAKILSPDNVHSTRVIPRLEKMEGERKAFWKQMVQMVL